MTSKFASPTLFPARPYRKLIHDLLQDRYLRSVADFRNLQDRTKRDIQSARDFAIQRFAGDLIESVDNLDRALGTVPASKLAPQNSDPDASSEDNTYNKDLANLYDGLKMTETILMGTLKKHGLERFDPSEGGGQPFNPNLHEATFQTKVDGKEDGKVFITQQKGFLLNGRVLRVSPPMAFCGDGMKSIINALIGRKSWCRKKLINIPGPYAFVSMSTPLLRAPG